MGGLGPTHVATIRMMMMMIDDDDDDDDGAVPEPSARRMLLEKGTDAVRHRCLEQGYIYIYIYIYLHSKDMARPRK